MKKIKLLSIAFIISLFVSCSNSNEVTLESDGNKTEDALICKILPFQNFGEDESIHLYSSKQGDSVNVNRVLINFKEIPANVKIDSAFLQLKFNKTSSVGKENYGENGFIVQRIISPWTESDVNWTNMPFSTDINQVFNDKTKLTRNPKKINVTRLVQDISSDKDNSYGFLLKLISEKSNNNVLIASFNHKDKELQPKLKIYYSK